MLDPEDLTSHRADILTLDTGLVYHHSVRVAGDVLTTETFLTGGTVMGREDGHRLSGHTPQLLSQPNILSFMEMFVDILHSLGVKQVPGEFPQGGEDN